jgi:hypothetical protein
MTDARSDGMSKKGSSTETKARRDSGETRWKLVDLSRDVAKVLDSGATPRSAPVAPVALHAKVTVPKRQPRSSLAVLAVAGLEAFVVGFLVTALMFAP